MTLNDLKARAYDLLAAMQSIQNQLNEVNGQIANFKEEVKENNDGDKIQN